MVACDGQILALDLLGRQDISDIQTGALLPGRGETAILIVLR